MRRVPSLVLPLAMIAALTLYAWADLKWWGIAVVAACVAYMPFELRRDWRRKREQEEIDEWKRGVR